jgi:hypothetical protein
MQGGITRHVFWMLYICERGNKHTFVSIVLFLTWFIYRILIVNVGYVKICCWHGFLDHCDKLNLYLTSYHYMVFKLWSLTSMIRMAHVHYVTYQSTANFHPANIHVHCTFPYVIMLQTCNTTRGSLYKLKMLKWIIVIRTININFKSLTFQQHLNIKVVKQTHTPQTYAHTHTPHMRTHAHKHKHELLKIGVKNIFKSRRSKKRYLEQCIPTKLYGVPTPTRL